MTEQHHDRVSGVIRASLNKRYARERRFQWYGRLAVLTGFLFLFVLLIDIVLRGSPAFIQHYIKLEISIDAQLLAVGLNPDEEALYTANYAPLIRQGLAELFPGVDEKDERQQLNRLLSIGAEYELRDQLVASPALLGGSLEIWLRANANADSYLKGQIDKEIAETSRRVTDRQIQWLDQLREQGRVDARFNAAFFSSGDSREPELAGIKAALYGSFLTLLVTFSLAFPVGVLAAVYLEEFAPRNRLTDLLEININNLAAVPSIVFGLLGLAVFINFFALPRSAPLVGGLVLALMTLPTIIITARASIQSVPNSIREAAMGVGASHLQTVFHHVMPVAMPGILTGSIIGMAQALGETAPLLMIGMVAFIADVPSGVMDSSTVLPVQIFLWSDSPERGFTEKTSAAIMVLMSFLILMNALAIYLRRRFEMK